MKMSFCKNALQVAMLFFGLNAFAALNWFNVPAPTHYDWKAEDDSISGPHPDRACSAINAIFHSQIKCSIDHASWDNHFKAQLAIPKLKERDVREPAETCNYSGLMFLYNQNHATGNYVPTTVGDAEFKSKVKSIVCSIDEKATNERLEFKNGTLKFVFGPVSHSSVDWWPEMFKFFPKIKADYEQRH
jgi:hypothetical protein